MAVAGRYPSYFLETFRWTPFFNGVTRRLPLDSVQLPDLKSISQHTDRAVRFLKNFFAINPLKK
jgi:hypothetical protein